MIRVENALNTVLKDIKTLGIEVVTLTDSLARVLACDIHSNSSVPAFGNSAMDGYALKSHDTRGASGKYPKVLEVIEDLRAGYTAKKALKAGQAIRIMTGALVPDGADSVVMVEETKKVSSVKCQVSSRMKKEFVRIFKEIKPGENIRKRGEDIKKGERIIQKGTLLRSAHIGILASLGIPKIKVTKKPRIAVLATGDEVIGVGKRLTPGKLYNSNTYALYSQIINCGAIPKNLGIAKDRPAELAAKIEKGLDCDMILTSGGVSVGDYDLVRDVLAKMGADIKFWKVAMRPGKPLAFGHIKGIPIFGLPGNPVSSMVSFEVFVLPVILKMLGLKMDFRNNEVEAIIEEDIAKKKGLRYFLRAHTCWDNGVYFARTTGPQGSGILKSMALANSLIILPEAEERIEKGKKVTVRFLD